MPSLQPCIEGYFYVTGKSNLVGLLLRRTLYTFCLPVSRVYKMF
jgi:hypothetical protein